MNTGVSPSYSSSHSLNDSLTMLPHLIADDENSIISWYHTTNNDIDNEDNRDSGNNYEDFIDIDMVPDIPNSLENSTEDDSVDPVQEAKCLRNFLEILMTHRTIFRDTSVSVINRTIKEEDRTAILKSKADFSECIANTINISCYNEGITALLQIFNRIDHLIKPYALTINDCRCTPNHIRRYISQIRYALETAGDKCQHCSMDYILENLNSKFLANVARSQFFTVQEIIDSVERESTEIGLGATSSCFNSQHSSIPETGWLRRWLKQYRNQEAIVAIIYCETRCERLKNRLNFRIVDYYTDEEFHLTIPMETVRDGELELRLLQEEKVYVLKSEMLSFEHRAEEFDSLIHHPNQRVHDMNVLGQIVGMFREKTVENFRDVSRPRGIHTVKVPNMHRHGVLVTVPLCVTLAARVQRGLPHKLQGP